jgi:hypothetical protein
MNNDLTEFGYIGDFSDLIIDIFTGCMFTEQDQRRATLLQRGIEWNEFWEGNLMKLPEEPSDVLCPYIDRYLINEYSRYIEAWLETDAPAKGGNFSRAKRAIDDNFAKGHFTRDIAYYGGEGFMPACGRQRHVFVVALAWYAQRSKQADPKPLGKFGHQVKALATALGKERAAAAHSPSLTGWDLGR